MGKCSSVPSCSDPFTEKIRESGTMLVKVKMARGGQVNLDVEGQALQDKDLNGNKTHQVYIDSIKWPGGGTVASKNIASMIQVEEAFLEALEGQRER